MAFSRDGGLLALGGDDGSVILWDTQRRQIRERLEGRGGWSVAFSPDGEILALGGDGVILWDIQRRQQIGGPLKGPGDVGGESMAFSPDGRILASGGYGSVILWDVDIESWKERSCRIVNRNLTRSEWAQYLEDEPYHKTCPNVPEGR
jgi:WD40 repeat protein